MNNELELRVLEVFTHSGLSRQDFAERLGISNAVLSHLSSGRNKASTELLRQLLLVYPEINPDWLLFGKGEMKRQDNQNQLIRSISLIENQLTELKKQMVNGVKKIEELETVLKAIKKD